jgi:hypothetical protein
MAYEDDNDITTAHRVASALGAPRVGAAAPAPVALPPLSRASLVLRRMPAAAFVGFASSSPFFEKCIEYIVLAKNIKFKMHEAHTAHSTE